MSAIGHVALQGDGRFRGTLATVTLRAPIEIVPTIGKTGDTQPDYRVIVNGVEIGAAWSRTSQQSGKPSGRFCCGIVDLLKLSSYISVCLT